MDKIDGPLTKMLNTMGMQLMSFALAIVIAYGLTSFILSMIKVPAIVRNFIATVVTLIVMYYTYIKLFL
ncbi:hypothetical protein [Rummeliibacillus sp. TYF-LIM-RU47]|uniref:hypothetical protein n=1 Tax=Rummeliibacillus sp. TYF-LIM-RU47 TaxID=2608406 RepID=UPI0012398C6B|nr:hypothetical protein [Rummeliibacillus sp. TYF-LIM-RU47]